MKLVVKSALVLAAMLGAQTAMAACNYTPKKEGFDFGWTFYGGPQKTYVVTKNTFKKYELASPNSSLAGSTITIDPKSLDTSADLTNWDGSGKWTPAIATMRTQNVVNFLFNKFANPKEIKAKILDVSKGQLNLEVTMNNVTKVLPMTYTVNNGQLVAKGPLEILDFNTQSAWKSFEAICTAAWHQGKSWSEIDLEFSVNVEGQCN